MLPKNLSEHNTFSPSLYFTSLESINVRTKRGGMAREIKKKRYVDRKKHGILHEEIMVLILSKGSIFLLSTPISSTVSIYIFFHSKEKACTFEHLPLDMTELAHGHFLLYYPRSE